MVRTLATPATESSVAWKEWARLGMGWKMEEK